MRKHTAPQPPEMSEVESRAGVRGAVKKVFDYLRSWRQDEQGFRDDVFKELNPLYGEEDYVPASLADGAQATIAIAVPGAQLGYTVEVSYDQPLQGFQKTESVDAADLVNVVLQNNTGGPITLAAGRFRAYVWPRQLTP